MSCKTDSPQVPLRYKVECSSPWGTLEFKVEPHTFRALVLERLRLPLDVTEARCECGIALDVFGKHRAACPRSGRLRTRAVGPERTVARVCREAGTTVRTNTKLRDMNVALDANDERAIEVLASGLPFHQGAQLVVDITCVTTAAGMATAGSSHTDGVVLQRAQTDQERKHAELLHSERCRLVVVGLETGGQWSPEAVDCESVGRKQSARCLTYLAGVGLLRIVQTVAKDALSVVCKSFGGFVGAVAS